MEESTTKRFWFKLVFSKQHFWYLGPRLFEVNAFQDWLIQIRELCSTKYVTTDNFKEISKDVSYKNHPVKWQEYKIWNFLRKGYALYGKSRLVTTTPSMSRRNPSLHSAYWGQILSKIAKNILRRNELAKFIITQCTIGFKK